MTSNSIISPKAKIATGVTIGDFVRVHDNVVIEAGTKIGDHCVIGQPASVQAYANKLVRIGEDSVIRSHTVIYEGSEFGKKLETGHHVVIREGTQVGLNLRVGNFSDIEGACTIGDYCRFHGYAHIGRGSVLGNFIWIYSLVTLTNDPLPPSKILQPVTIDDGVVVAVGSTVLPGSHLGRGSFVAAGSQVHGVVPVASVWKGSGVMGSVHRLASLEHGVQHPWMRHFAEAFPVEAQDRLKALSEAVLADSRAFSTRKK